MTSQEYKENYGTDDYEDWLMYTHRDYDFRNIDYSSGTATWIEDEDNK